MACEGLVVRKLSRSDADDLLEVLISSDPSDREPERTLSSLVRDLSSGDDLELVNAQQVLSELDDPTIELDLTRVKSNVPACQGFLATTADKELVGFVLFHYHFSPWNGHTAAIDQIFVKPEYRNKGIANRLMDELRSLCAEEGITKFLYEISRIPHDLMGRIREYGTRIYRNDETDWCVFRINFN